MHLHEFLYSFFFFLFCPCASFNSIKKLTDPRLEPLSRLELDPNYMPGRILLWRRQTSVKVLRKSCHNFQNREQRLSVESFSELVYDMFFFCWLLVPAPSIEPEPLPGLTLPGILFQLPPIYVFIFDSIFGAKLEPNKSFVLATKRTRCFN